MQEDQARRIAIVVGIMLVSIVIALATVQWGFYLALGVFAGILLVMAAFLRPEWTLLAVTIAAPLYVYMVKVPGITGTGITPVNGMMILLVIGAFLHRYSTTPPAAEATPVDKPLLLFLAWSALSIITGVLFWFFDPKGIGEWLQLAAGYSTFWVVRRRWNSRRLAVFAVWVVMAMVAYQSFVVIKQYLNLDPTAFSWDLKKQIVGTMALPYTGNADPDRDVTGNSNDVAAYLSAYGLVAFGLFLLMKRNFLRWPALLIFLAAGAATFATYSRAGMLAMIAGCLCMAMYKQKKLLLPLIAVVAILPSVLPASISERFVNTGDASADSRKDVWKRAAIVSLRNPFIGVGWRAYYKTQQNDGYKLRDPHNMFLLVSAEQGIPGLVFFVGALLGCGKIITDVLRRKHSPFVDGLALGMFGALVCFTVNNVFGSRMIYIYVVQHFWLLMGLLVVLAYARPKEGEDAVSVEVAEPEPVLAGPRPESPWRYRTYG
ncbi:MAG: O-antigen ligase family protein [Deltaproteobacteria bacterium]|nr:O-antigen ligase family protein [Deltaproteobacteria bacterium]